MKKPARILLPVLVLGVLCLCGCAEETPGKLADGTTHASVYTNAYTNLDAPALMESLARYEGVSVVATVNLEGTPNAASFIPAALPPDHVAFSMGESATRENILRTGVAVLFYDVPNTAEELKALQHSGAIAQLKLVTDADAIKALEEQSGMTLSDSIVMEIDTLYPVG